MGNWYSTATSAAPWAKVAVDIDAFTENVVELSELHIQLGFGDETPAIDLRISDPCVDFMWDSFYLALTTEATIEMSRAIPNGSIEIALTATHIRFCIAHSTELDVMLPRNLFAKVLADELEKQLLTLSK